MKIHNIAKCLLAAILTSSPSCLLAQTLPAWAYMTVEPGASGAEVWGDPVNGLQMSLYFDQTGTNPQLKVALRNVGSSELTVTLGIDCGWPDGPNSVKLIFTDDQGKSQRIDYYSDPAHRRAVCAGAVEAWQVHLSPGASFSIPINTNYFGYFLPVAPWSFVKGWQPGGTYLLQADLFAVKSNQLQVHIPRESAATNVLPAESAPTNALIQSPVVRIQASSTAIPCSQRQGELVGCVSGSSIAPVGRDQDRPK
jgi:hypothetical protein